MPDFVDSVFNSAHQVVNTTQYWASYAYEGAQNMYREQVESAPEPILEPIQSQYRQLWQAGLGAVNSNMKYNALLMYAAVPLGIRLFWGKTHRRAMRLPFPASGSGTTRFEVILIIGQPDSPFVSKLIHDMNKRGYVVYVVVENERELQIVEKLNDSDIRHLWIDWTNDTTVKTSLLKLAKVLDAPITPNSSYFYNFKAVLFTPNYNHLPKAKDVTDINTAELKRVLESHFNRFNTLLYNGLTTIMTESNVRRDDLWVTNGLRYRSESTWKSYLFKSLGFVAGSISSLLKLNYVFYPGGISKGGATKLLWVNFLVQYNTPSNVESEFGMTSSNYTNSFKTRVIINLLQKMNSSYFKVLIDELGPSLLESLWRSFGIINNPHKLDMSMVNVDIVKGHGGYIKHKSEYTPSLAKSSLFGNVNKVVLTTWDSIYQVGAEALSKINVCFTGIIDHFLDNLCNFIAILTGTNYGGRRKGVNPRRVHYLIYDLINQSSLSNEYWIS